MPRVTVAAAACWCAAPGAASARGLRGAAQVADAAATAAPGQGSVPGARLAVSQHGLDYVRGVAVPLLLKMLDPITAPDQSGDKSGFGYKVSSIACHAPSLQSSTLDLVAGQGVQLGLSGIGLSCSAHWSARADVWPHPSDSGDVSIDVGGSSATALLTTSVNATGALRLGVGSCTAGVHVSGIHFSGGITGAILNLLKGPIEGAIEGAVNPALCSAIKGFVGTNANAMVDSFSYKEPLPFPAPYDVASVDFSFLNLTVADAYVGAALKGECAVTGAAGATPLSPSALPSFDASAGGRMLQLLVSPYPVDTLSYAFFEKGLLSYTVTPAMVPSASPVNLTTTDFLSICPGMLLRYPHSPMEISIAATTAPQLRVAPGRLSVATNATFHFQVVDGVERADAFTVQCAAEAAAEVNVTGGSAPSVTAELTTISCDLSELASSFGPVVISPLSDFVNAVVPYTLIPYINSVIGKGFPLPSVGGVSFVNPAITVNTTCAGAAGDVCSSGRCKASGAACDAANSGGFLLIGTDVQYNAAA